MEAEKRSQEKSLETVQSYKRLFSSDDGILVLEDLMINSRFLNTTHVQGDPYSSANNEGRRELFIYIMNKIQASPEDMRKRIEQLANKQREEDFYYE